MNFYDGDLNTFVGIVIMMEYSPSDIADRYTIVKLKINRLKDKSFRDEYLVLNKEIEKLISAGMLKKAQIARLYRVNSKIWDLEAHIGNYSKGNKNFKKIAILALQVRKWNTVRTNIKSEIVSETKMGFRESKKFYFTG